VGISRPMRDRERADCWVVRGEVISDLGVLVHLDTDISYLRGVSVECTYLAEHKHVHISQRILDHLQADRVRHAGGTAFGVGSTWRRNGKDSKGKRPVIQWLEMTK